MYEAPNTWLCDNNPKIDVSILTAEEIILVIIADLTHYLTTVENNFVLLIVNTCTHKHYRNSLIIAYVVGNNDIIVFN